MYLDILIQSAVAALTFIVAVLITVRGFAGYRLSKNSNLLLLSTGFLFLCLYFIMFAVANVFMPGSLYSFPRRFTLSFLIEFLQVVAYLFIMLAYVVKPRSEEIALAMISPFVLVSFTFELFILLLLGVILVSVWSAFSAKATAGTALVLSSFLLLFLLHLVRAILLFSPRSLAAGELYYTIMQLLAFFLLFMAIGFHTNNEKRGSSSA